MVPVHIVVPEGIPWLGSAQRLAEVFAYVSVGAAPNALARIQYYLPFRDVPDRISSLQLAYLEEDASPDGVSLQLIDRWIPANEAGARLLSSLGVPSAQILPPQVPEAGEEWLLQQDALFRSLAAGLPSTACLPDRPTTVQRVGIYVARDESVTKGGPGLLVPRTAQMLACLGIEGQVEALPAYPAHDYDLMHLFNVWPPADTLRRMWELKCRGVPIVFSPIFLDLSDCETFDKTIPAIFRESPGAKERSEALSRVQEACKAHWAARATPSEPFPDYFDQVRQMVEWSTHVIVLSHLELQHLKAIGAAPASCSVVLNCTTPVLYAQARPDLFERTYGLRDFVLCVGRIEGRKNQVLLVHALRDAGIPIVLVGSATDSAYNTLVREQTGAQVLLIDRIPPDSPMMASAYAACRVFAQPSWAEGLSLAALEAAAAGCRMVLSERSSEKEYFGEMASYCDPINVDDIRDKVLAAYYAADDEDRRARLRQHIAENFTWERNIRDTVQAYEAAVARADVPLVTARPASAAIYFDLSQWAYHDGPPTGIARVEFLCGLALHGQLGDSLRFVAHHRQSRTFLPLSIEDVCAGRKSKFAEHSRSGEAHALKLPYSEMEFARGGTFLAFGGRWLSDSQHNYTRDIIALKNACGLRVVVLAHDVIRYKFPEWYTELIRTVFIERFSAFVSAADLVLCCSECSARDLAEFCLGEGLETPPTVPVRLGDSIAATTAPCGDAVAFPFQDLPFVLCVSGLDRRKNHQLLYEVWCSLRQAYGERVPALVCVGETGEGTAALVDTIRQDPRTSDRIHILHDVEDPLLHRLYQQALFTVYPSLYEGWGMPVAESLSYGKICLAAKNPAVMEIAPSLTDLLDPCDVQAWYTAVERYVFDESARGDREQAIRSGYRCASWDDTATQIRKAVAEQPALPEKHRPRPPAAPISFRHPCPPAHAPALDFQSGGWCRSDADGTWTCGALNVLTVPAVTVASYTRLLLARVKPYLGGGDTAVVCVNVSEGRLHRCRWAVARSGWQRAFVCSASDLQDSRDGKTSLLFKVLNARRPADSGSSQDQRLLGLQFEAIRFAPCVSLPVGRRIGLGTAELDPVALSASGWTDLAPRGMGMTGANAYLCFEGEGGGGEPLFLVAESASLAPESVGGIHLQVNVNGALISQHFLESAESVSIRVPLSQASARGPLFVEFAVRGSGGNHPTSSEYDDGKRSLILLNVGVVPLAQMDAPTNYSLGEDIIFGIRGNAAPFLAGDWGHCGPGSTAALLPGASLWLPLAHAARGALLLTADLRVPPFPQDRPWSILILANGNPGGRWQIAQGGLLRATAVLDAELVREVQELRLGFDVTAGDGGPSGQAALSFLRMCLTPCVGEQAEGVEVVRATLGDPLDLAAPDSSAHALLIRQIHYTKRLFEALSQEASVVLGSAQWRTGVRLGRRVARLLPALLPPPVADRMREVREAYAACCAALAARRLEFESFVDEAAPVPRAETELPMRYAEEQVALEEDARFLFGLYDELAACIRDALDSECFQTGDLIVGQAARLRLRPRSAGFLQRIESQLQLFENWRRICQHSPEEDRRRLMQ